MKLSAAACRRLTLRPIRGVWFRAIAPAHWETALSTGHTLQTRGRFNPGPRGSDPFEILYLAENQTVALYEVESLFGPPEHSIINPHNTKYLAIDVDVCLQSVADLSQPSEQSILGLSAQEITGSWQPYEPGEAPTQRLGAALFATKNLEGFLTLSARVPRCKTLIVFPEKLQAGSELVFQDLITHKIHKIPPT